MANATNRVVWFDVPCTDLDRAIRFYREVLGVGVEKQGGGGNTIGVLAHGQGEVSGCLFSSPDHKPSDGGVMLYFNVNGRLDDALAAAQRLGAKVIQPKHQIGPWGCRAVILDSEGNRIALHST